MQGGRSNKHQKTESPNITSFAIGLCFGAAVLRNADKYGTPKTSTDGEGR